MSAQVYSAGMSHAPRTRNPLAPTVSHRATNVRPFPQMPTPPPKPQVKPADPPLQRQTAKVTPPSPPKVIVDKSGNINLSRGAFLGEASVVTVTM